MGKDTDEIIVGANGTIWTADVGTAAPADESAAPGAGWVDLGYASEDGVTPQDGKTLEVIRVWQLFHAARQLVTERDTQLAFVLRQWNKDTVVFAFGGGTITAPTVGHFKYTPPSPESIAEKALMIDWVDGTKKYRWVVPRGTVTEGIETNLVRTGPADLPITFGVLGSDGVDPWYLLTNDPAFDPA